MKTITKTVRVAVAMLAVVAFSVVGTQQAQAQVVLGGGLAFGTDVESLGIQAGGHYMLNEEQGIRLAADLIFFFPGEDVPGFDLNVFEINFNGHYLFYSEEELMAYALAGIAIDAVTIETPFGDASDSEVGLNLGAGVEYEMPFGYLYGELKVVAGGFGQVVVSGGVRFPVGGN